MPNFFFRAAQVVRALLQCDSDTPPAKKTAVGESSLVVWKFSCVERLDSCYAEVNIKIFLDELHSEAARRLVSSKRRYNALISTAEGLAPSSSCRSFLDLLMSMLKSSGVICESFDDASLSRFMKLLQGVVRCDKRSDGDGDMILCKSDCAFILRVSSFSTHYSNCVLTNVVCFSSCLLLAFQMERHSVALPLLSLVPH